MITQIKLFVSGNGIIINEHILIKTPTFMSILLTYITSHFNQYKYINYIKPT